MVLTDGLISSKIVSNLILNNPMKERSSNVVTVLRKPGVDATWYTQ